MPPVSAYFSGHGAEVMASMKRKYGEEKGERVFYATANKRGQKPSATDAQRAGFAGRRVKRGGRS